MKTLLESELSGFVSNVRVERDHRIDWAVLYRIAGYAAVVAALLIPVQLAVFVLWPPPLGGGAAAWFEMLHDNALVGLLNLDLLLLIDYVLLAAIFVAIYVALRPIDRPVATLATVLYLIGVAIYFSSNTAFEMLSVSDRFAAAATEAQRSVALAAGTALLATWQGTAFHVSYVLNSLVGIVFGVLMLRTGRFSRFGAYLLAGGNAVGLALYVPTVGVYISAFSGFMLWIWFAIVARDLFRLGAAEDPR